MTATTTSRARDAAPRGALPRGDRPQLRQEFGYDNIMQVPGSPRSWSTWASARPPRTPSDRRRRARPRDDHRPEAGGHQARKSIAQFKLREGMPIGARSRSGGTACGSSSTGCWPRAAAHPRLPGRFAELVRGRGNYTFGLREQLFSPRSTPTRSTDSGAGDHGRDHRATDEEGWRCSSFSASPLRGRRACGWLRSP